MTTEDDKNLFPIRLQMSGGFETLLDGRHQVAFVCESLAEYLQLPSGLHLGTDLFRRVGRDPARGVAYYRTGEVADNLSKAN
jgi:hypothetical protein